MGIVTAFLGTSCIFVCFSLGAVLAERRSMLYLGGFLSSAISLLFMMSFMSMMFGSSTLFFAQLYLGLLVFCGYVIFDTQMIIERASLGDRDHVQHATHLFMDFVAIFVRLLIILSKDK